MCSSNEIEEQRNMGRAHKKEKKTDVPKHTGGELKGNRSRKTKEEG